MQITPKQVVRDGYDEVATSYLDARTRVGADIDLLDELLQSLPERCRVLDAGCGAGVPVSEQLVAAGRHVSGLDISLGQLALAQQHVPDCALVLADMASLPFGSASFDAVVSFYAVIHVPRDDHPRVFSEFHRVLRPDGTALLCLGWDDVPEDHDPESWLGVPMYWSHFDAETNLALLEKTGFTIESSRQVLDPMDHACHLFVRASA